MKKQEMDWDKARENLLYVRQYLIQMPLGIDVLTKKVEPLLKRYYSGERSEDLYMKIMYLDIQELKV